MPKKKAKDFRGMSANELSAHIRSLREEYFNLRIQQATGQLENNQRLRIVRKELACALTVQGEAAAQ
ncbi:50S ribosomal protein L29 [Akkermansia glycaniphila]|uniref:Large ribosomal subunit protein uL29 n=1 Tax=Akkermansia glycaniphila TaxID=1679444 RepID=A0A1C7PCL9_9BACT|nr:50S ribosomal protein L29 [Akkermansia glycaniphila]MBT9448552.1 50S ribosomal protein L29 [Akkermansia glycaniphila]OCA03323.1 50S ribosomal protein L29 [Akkermansia glycaniphila]SEH80518.1 ribosomal protein l29 [Akkermansia glycaniphila]